MKIPQFTETITKLFAIKGIAGIETTGINFSKYNYYSNFLVSKANGNKIEIPVIGIYKFFEDDLKCCADGFYFPLGNTHAYTNIALEERKTINSVFRLLLGDCANNILNTVSIKDIIYLGNTGIILKEDFEPILLNTIDFNINIDSIGGVHIIFDTYNIYLNPKVFLSEDPVESYLRKKIIPYVLHNGLVTEYIKFNLGNVGSSFDNMDTDKILPSIIISENIHKFFSKPTPPDASDTSKDINNFLSTKISDILNVIE